ncbi:MAG: outer membrane beta-barrel protein, partial [Bacteroidetes bacterium]|nr:outer membrane beta-barrel protein [Bacteroidota bacterium]
MKKLFILLLCTIALNAYTQVVNEKAKKLFTFGVDVYTDIWQDVPTTIEPKTINPGVNIFGSYNFMFGESNFSFSPGVGLGIHNLFSSSFLYSNNDYSYFIPINDTMPDLSYKKSKLVLTYFDIPMEIRFKSKSEFRIAVGFKFGFLIKGHTKYKG